MSDQTKVKKIGRPAKDEVVPPVSDAGSLGSLGFTREQYEHFKFGLIKKNGEKVPDYEKKLAQYEAYIARGRKSKKSA